MVEAVCGECGHAADAHLAGLGCLEIIGWEVADISGAALAVGTQLSLTFGKRTEAPLFCGCWRGIEGRTNAKEAAKETGI